MYNTPFEELNEALKNNKIKDDFSVDGFISRFKYAISIWNNEYKPLMRCIKKSKSKPKISIDSTRRLTNLNVIGCLKPSNVSSIVIADRYNCLYSSSLELCVNEHGAVGALTLTTYWDTLQMCSLFPKYRKRQLSAIMSYCLSTFQIQQRSAIMAICGNELLYKKIVLPAVSWISQFEHTKNNACDYMEFEDGKIKLLIECTPFDNNNKFEIYKTKLTIILNDYIDTLTKKQ